MKPLKSGKAEIDMAPTMQKAAVQGIELVQAAQLEALTGADPEQHRAHGHEQQGLVEDMGRRRGEIVPFRASSVPTPMPTTMKPSWLLRL